MPEKCLVYGNERDDVSGGERFLPRLFFFKESEEREGENPPTPCYVRYAQNGRIRKAGFGEDEEEKSGERYYLTIEGSTLVVPFRQVGRSPKKKKSCPT